MVTLGITGQIASGKTTVASEFANFGGKIISADEIGREIIEENPPVLSKLIRAFGKEIATPQGALKRRELGKIAFSSAKNREILNRIVHPLLLRRLEELLKQMQNDPTCQLVIVDAALLIDWGWEKKMDWVIGVIAPEELQVSRLLSKGFSREEVKERIAAQRTVQEFRQAADFIILNNGTLEDLQEKVRAIYEEIRSRSANPNA